LSISPPQAADFFFWILFMASNYKLQNLKLDKRPLPGQSQGLTLSQTLTGTELLNEIEILKHTFTKTQKMKYLKISLLAVAIFASCTLIAQVAITPDGSEADPSAMLDVSGLRSLSWCQGCKPRVSSPGGDRNPKSPLKKSCISFVPAGSVFITLN